MGNVEKHGKIAHLGRLLQVLEDVLQKIQLNIIHPSLVKKPYLAQKICKAGPLVTAKIRQDFLDLPYQPTSPGARTRKSPLPRAAKCQNSSINSCHQNDTIDVAFPRVIAKWDKFFAKEHIFKEFLSKNKIQWPPPAVPDCK